MPVYKKVNKDFFKKWNGDMAYVLGFFAADGYITVNKRGAHFWCIQITDKDLLERIKKLIESEHKISSKVGKENHKIIYRLQIGSMEMCDDLRKLGMRENKTKSLVVPNFPKKYFSSFVRGYFDGDGNVWSGLFHKERKKTTPTLITTFTSCSKDFLNIFHKKLQEFGIAGGSLFGTKGNYYRLTFSTGDSLKLYDFMYNTNVLDGMDIFLSRKKCVFEKYIKVRS